MPSHNRKRKKNPRTKVHQPPWHVSPVRRFNYTKSNVDNFSWDVPSNYYRSGSWLDRPLEAGKIVLVPPRMSFLKRIKKAYHRLVAKMRFMKFKHSQKTGKVK